MFVVVCLFLICLCCCCLKFFLRGVILLFNLNLCAAKAKRDVIDLN